MVSLRSHGNGLPAVPAGRECLPAAKHTRRRNCFCGKDLRGLAAGWFVYG